MKTSTEELRNAGVVMIKQPSDKMTLRLPMTEGKGVIPGPFVVKNNGEAYTKLHFLESSLESYWSLEMFQGKVSQLGLENLAYFSLCLVFQNCCDGS